MINHSVHGLFESEMGWDGVDQEQVIEELLRLGPELVNELDLTGWHGPPVESGAYELRHQTVQEFALTYELPYNCGVHWEFNPDLLHGDWYSQLGRDEKWEYPDGSVVEHPSEILAKDFGGNIRGRNGGDNLIQSSFAAGAKDRLIRTGQDLFELGVTQFWIDSPVGELGFGFDFSEWAQEAFREHLATLDDTELERLGIDDRETFDIVGYLSTNNLAPYDTDHPERDPVYREFVQFQHEQQSSFVTEVFEGVRKDLPDSVEDAGTTVFGLGFGLQYHALNPASIYKSDDVDVVAVETQPTVPPDRPHDVTFKIARAAGHFEKPVRVWGRMNEPFGTTYGFDTDGYYKTLMRFQMAQAYCHGGRRSIPITSLPNHSYDQSVNSWLRPDGTIPDTMHDFVDFIRAHRRFLTEVEEANSTCLIVSLPTLIWQYNPDWDQGAPTPHSEAIGEAANVLREEHIPYDVLIFDQPPIWEAPEQLERLSEYDTVLLPGIDCMTNSHVSAIEEVLSEESTVIATGELPNRDEDYEEHKDVATLFENHSNGLLIDHEPDIDGESESASVLRSKLDTEDRDISIDTIADVSINLHSQTNPDRLVVHLLNYEYDRDSDSMEKLTDLQVSLRELPFEPSEAKYYTVDGQQSVEIDTDGSIDVEVPYLDIWGILVFGADSEALSPAVSAETAQSAIDDATARLQQHKNDIESSEERLFLSKLQNARQSVEYGGYEVAQELAQDVFERLESLQESEEEIDDVDADGDDTNEAEAADTDENGRDDAVDEVVPGFGIGGAVAGLAGVSYLLTQRLSDSDEVE
ncbi:hypothetical protein HUB97_13985 [Halorubraceae archaeon YAN]|nr:hypothetical protein [Halorubraceae archaeon YAN]